MRNRITIFVNERPLAEGEWQMISPYGEFKNTKGLQRVDRQSADRMVLAYNSLAARIGRLFRGMPIYVGHPDVLPKEFSDKRRYGAVQELEAREDALYGRVAWNDLGEQNRVQGYYIYPSPAWVLQENGDGTWSPNRLLSVGLTNNPNILTVEPWVNEALPVDESENDVMKTIPEWLAKALKLPDTATDEEAQAAFGALETSLAEATAKADKLATELADVTAKADAAVAAKGVAEAAQGAAETTAANERTLHAEALVTVAINSQWIAPGDRAAWMKKLDADFGNAAGELERTAVNTKGVDLGGARKAIATAEDRRRELDVAVNSRMGGGLSYDEAWAAVKRDPQFKELWQAMGGSNG